MTPKNNKTNRQMIEEIYTVLLGVPGTEDNGLVGELKDLGRQVQGISRAVQTNTTWRKALMWVVGIILTSVGVLFGITLS